jgi:hypothetical protein
MAASSIPHEGLPKQHELAVDQTQKVQRNMMDGKMQEQYPYCVA